MANIKNLKPFTTEQSHEQAVKNGRKGGKASAKSKKAKKTIAEQVKAMMAMDISDANPKMKGTLVKLGITESDTQYSAAVVAAMLQKAIQGDVKAADWIIKMAGEEPRVEIDRLRLDLERQRFEAEKTRVAETEDIIRNMQTLAEIIRHPAPNRDIEDFE